MVVMTIISVLLGLTLTGFLASRKTARDGKRKSDLEQIRSALEMCYSEDNVYPPTGSIDSSVTCVGGQPYLNPTPKDPSTEENYYYSSTGATYTLCATLEASSPDDCGENGNYQVTNP
jgi:general secretion pathway protein G